MAADGKRHVLIAGGGVAALEAALALRAIAADRVAVELLAPDSQFWYRPLAVAEPFELGEARRFELADLARELGATLTAGALTGIDEWRHVAHTSTNKPIPYDVLLVACGVLPIPAIPGALTFRGPTDIEPFRRLLQEIEQGDVRSVAFVIPWGAGWPLPIYELALLTAAHLENRGMPEVAVTLVTPEEEPLQQFGSAASDAVRSLLGASGVELRALTYASAFSEGELEFTPEGSLPADRVVALPRLEGAPIDGLPQTVTGFIPVDAQCRVSGVADVFAAGDITNFGVKQGGIATQQADVAAAAIAADAGADVVPTRFEPVLRGLLLTGRQPRYLRRELGPAPVQEPVASYEPLWWPPAKIVGRHLAPFLASLAGSEPPASGGERPANVIELEVHLDPEVVVGPTSTPWSADHDASEAHVAEAMSPDPLVVAPEDTLGELAERMLESGTTAAVVSEYGRVIGILTTGDLIRASAMRVHPSEGRARQWMTAEPVTVSPRTSASVAVRLARDYGIHHLPVVESGHAVGMLVVDDAQRQVEMGIGLGF